MNMKTFLTSAEQFLHESYCAIPFHFENGRAEEIYRVLHQLVLEPEHVRSGYQWNTLRNQEPDEGLIIRAGQNGHADWKAFWHHHPHLWNEYSKALGLSYQSFILSLNELQIMFHETSKSFANALDMVTDNRYQFIQRCMSNQGVRQSKIRVLEYFEPPVEKPIASKHFDKSLFTFAPHSTHHSLYLGNDQEFKPVVPDEHILCFAGNKMAMATGGVYVGSKVFEHAKIPAMSHIVHATGRKKENALVVFIHSDHTLPYE